MQFGMSTLIEIKSIEETAALCRELGLKFIELNMNLSERKAYLFKEYPNEYRQKLIAFRDTCTAAVGNADIKICIENTRSFQLDYVEEGILLLLESPVFGLTFDIGHNAGNNFQQQPVIERNINRLCHMHLHDYERTRGDHLPLGEGELDLIKYLDIAKKHNFRAVLEVKTVEGLRQSAEWLKERNWL